MKRCFRSATLILLIAMPLPALQAQDAEAPEGYDQALSSFRSGRYEESLQTIRGVFDNNRSSMHLRLLAAANYAALGYYDSAVAHMQCAMKDHPNRAEPGAMLAGIFRRQGRTDQAIRIAQTGLRQAGDNLDLRLELAAAYYAANRLTEARAQLERALALDAQNFHAIYLDGMIFLRQARYDNARFRFMNALNLEQLPRADLVGLYVNMGFALERLGDAALEEGQRGQAVSQWREAVRYYQYALRLDPQNGQARENLNRVEAREI